MFNAQGVGADKAYFILSLIMLRLEGEKRTMAKEAVWCLIVYDGITHEPGKGRTQ